MIAEVEIFDGKNRCWIEVVDNPVYRPDLPSDHWRVTLPADGVGHNAWCHGDWREMGPGKYRVMRLREKSSADRHTVLELSEWNWRAGAVGKGWHHVPGRYIAQGEVAWKITRLT